MNCTEIQTALDNYLDGDLATKDKLVVESHLEQCAACQQSLDDAATVRSMLSSLPLALPSDNFEKKAFSHVRQHYAYKGIADKSHNKFMAGFATAIAASLVIWVSSILFLMPNNTVPGNTAKVQVISVAMNEVQTIRLMLGSENDVKQVTLSLGLPDNIRLKGYESKKKLVWKTNLSKGDNILTLPVKAIASGQGNLIAQVQYGNKTKQFRILVKTLKEVIRGDVFINQTKSSSFV